MFITQLRLRERAQERSGLKLDNFLTRCCDRPAGIWVRKARLVSRVPGSGFKVGGGEKWYTVISIYRQVVIKGMNVIQRMRLSLAERKVGDRTVRNIILKEERRRVRRDRINPGDTGSKQSNLESLISDIASESMYLSKQDLFIF